MTLESNLTAFAQAVAADVKALSTGRGLVASQLGVSASAADNTAALAAIASARQTLTGRVVIDLPQGTVKGRLAMAPGVVWRLNGTRIVFPDSGPTGHMAYPLNPNWWGDEDGLGAHRSGIVGEGVLDGEQSRWGLNPMPKPAMPTLATAAGTLAAGWYGYRIAYKTTFGIGAPSDEQNIELTASGGVKLTWTNPAAAAAAQIVVSGRTPWDLASGMRTLATLPSGSTTWTDSGSVTPTGPVARLVDLSAPAGIVMTGTEWTLRGIKVEGACGTGIASQFNGESEASAPLARLMEARIESVGVERPGAEGIVLAGVHDITVRGCFISRPGATAPEPRSAVIANTNGPFVLADTHTWGTSKWCVENYCGGDIVNCQLEGGLVGAANLQERTRMIGCEVFHPIAAGAKGVVIGNAGYKPVVQIENTLFRMFNSSHGPAIDITNAGAGSRISGVAIQDTGTVIAGSTANKSVDITVNGSASAQAVRPVVQLTQAAYDALATKHAATLYVIVG